MPFLDVGGGWVEIIVGPMFSGKSDELIRRVTRCLIARQSVQVFKPSLDDRYAATAIASHDGRTLEAAAVADVADLRSRVLQGIRVVAIDEAQFFDDGIVELVRDLADGGTRVILAALDTDFRARPFGPVPALLAEAERVEKLTAICRCGRAATRTQRLIAGRPAHEDDPVILVGAAEAYEPRCRACHTVLRGSRPTPLFAAGV
jgi:thymidine kinase